MDKLISAEYLRDFIKNNICTISNDGKWEDLLDEIPAVYNVEKVVEELHNESCDYEAPCKSNLVKCKNCNHYIIGCKEAIDIVRKGGVE